MAYTKPTIAEFKTYFSRDFPYGTDPNTSVTDTDLEKAYVQASFNFNDGLFANGAEYKVGYLLLWAHYLVVDLRMSSQGVSGQFSFLEQSKSVGSVSQSFAVPQLLMENPYFSMLLKTNYGAKYLELMLPLLVGNTFAVCGTTLP